VATIFKFPKKAYCGLNKTRTGPITTWIRNSLLKKTVLEKLGNKSNSIFSKNIALMLQQMQLRSGQIIKVAYLI